MNTWSSSETAWCSQLHHSAWLSEKTVVDLLRAGADLHAVWGGDSGAASPLDVATESRAFASSCLWWPPAKPWSPASHHLFPEESRRYALSLAYLVFALSARFNSKVEPKGFSAGNLLGLAVRTFTLGPMGTALSYLWERDEIVLGKEEGQKKLR